jgi:peptidyl-tRNA hydrolase
VLQDFDKFDANVIEQTLDKALAAIEIFVREDLNAAMNKFNGTISDE